MAEERLLTALNNYIKSGNTPEETKKKLVRDGWNEQDVTGALAVHTLSLLPLGQNPGTQWTDMEAKNGQKSGFLSRIILVMLFVGIGMVIAKKYGYNVPFVPDVAFSKEIESSFSLEALSPFFHQFTTEGVLSTTSPTYEKNDSIDHGMAPPQQSAPK